MEGVGGSCETPLDPPLREEGRYLKIIFLVSEPYVVDNQKNSLNETVLSTQNTF